MGLPEKVALIIVFVAIEQIIFTTSSPREKAPSRSYSSRTKQKTNTDPPIVITLRPRIQSANKKNKQNDKNHEALQKTFNFPDNEYPTASTPRPPFYLQEENILQRKPVQKAADYPTFTTVQYSISNKNDMYKMNSYSKPTQIKTKKKSGVTITLPEFGKPTQIKTKKKSGVTITLPEFGTTPKPYCFRDGAFPDVDYPLSAKDTWTPNYWKPMPWRPSDYIPRNIRDDNYKSEPIAKKSNVPMNRASVKARKKSVPNSQSKKRDSTSNQVPPAALSKKNKKTVNNNQDVTTKIEPGQNDLNRINLHTSTTTTQTVDTKTLNNQNSQHSTPASAQSENTKSTIPYELTPFTTLYTDKIPSYTDVKSSLNEEMKSTTPSPKTTAKKKKRKKNNVSSKQPKNTTLKHDDTAFVANSTSSHFYENQTDSYPPEESASQLQCPVTPLPEEPALFSLEDISESNLTKLDSCSCISNDPLDTRAVTITPSEQNNDINSTIIRQVKIAFTADKNVESNSDAIDTIVSDNSNSKETPRIKDNATNGHNSTTRDHKPNDGLFPRADVIDLPSADEEFTTDVIPDFDENVLGVFTPITSTLSPLTLSTVDEAWANAEVIDPYKSLSYPDELEQYYIIVP